MFKVSGIIFSCYAGTDLAWARSFYEGVLGPKPTIINESGHGKWAEYEFGPYAFAIGSTPKFKPNPSGNSIFIHKRKAK